MADITMGRIVKINMGKGRFLDCDIRVPLITYMDDNFQLHEMVDPTNNQLIYYPKLVYIMQDARDTSGCEIRVKNGLSWQRFEDYNRLVGGSDTSIHMVGGATDSKWYYKYKDTESFVQVHPIHCAYIMQEIANRYKVNCEIGVYLAGYDGSNTLGYLHFAITEGNNYFYYYDKRGKHEIQSLKEIVL